MIGFAGTQRVICTFIAVISLVKAIQRDISVINNFSMKEEFN